MLIRILSAVILLPAFLAIILLCPPICTTILFGAAGAVAAYELTWNTGLAKNKRLVTYAMVMAMATAVWCHFGMEYKWALIGALVFVSVLFGEMMITKMKTQFTSVVICGTAGVLVPFFLYAIIRLRDGEYGNVFVLIPFLICFISDSGAYFAGRFFGKYKLSPEISPKKTIEGAIGGIITTVVGMLIYGVVLERFFGFQYSYWICLVYALLGSLAGIFGDLCFSMIKRQTGIKDYGKIIPGHGGILDRFDSTLVIAPLVEILIIFLPVAVK